MKIKPIFFGPDLEIALLVLTLVALVIIFGLGIKQRLLLRIGIRNMMRRRGQALLLLGGLALSTAFITASFVLNDSIQNASRTQLMGSIGTIDETVTGTFTGEQAGSSLSAIRNNEHVQAATGLLESYHTASITSPRTGFSQDRLNVLGVPSDFDQVFGPTKEQQGQKVIFSDLQVGDIYLGSTLAQNFSAQVGDQLMLTVSGRHVTGTVRAILGTDIMTNASDVIFNSSELIVLSLPYYQQIMDQPGMINTIAITNVQRENDSRVVASFLQDLFHIPNYIGDSAAGSGKQMSISDTPTYLGNQLHVINPDLIYYLGQQSFINGLGAQGSSQFTDLAPALSILLVSTGMLLLALLLLLFASERRRELGISRAIGFQRAHVVQSLLIEGGGYGLLAVIPGILLGIGLVALELSILSLIPLQVGHKSTATIHLALSVWINWHSLLASFCLSILTTFLVVFCTAFWISRLQIVAAIRELTERARPQDTLVCLIHRLNKGSFSQRLNSVGRLVWGLVVRGPGALFIGLILVQLSTISLQVWLSQIAIALVIVALGLIVYWLLGLIKAIPVSFVRRLSLSLIGLGWLFYSIQPGGTLFRLFLPTGSVSTAVRLAGSGGLSINAVSIVLTNLLLIAGAVLVVMANSDLLVAFLTFLISRIRGLAPISRTSFAYPLAYRLRTTMTVSLLSMIVFLIVFVVILNVGSVQQADVTTAAGGYHLSLSAQNLPQNFTSLVEANPTLQAEISGIASIQSIGHASAHPRKILVPGQNAQNLSDIIASMSDSFFQENSMPLQTRAAGYSSDREVWEAVRTHSDYAVWFYEPNIKGIDATKNAFQPFTVQAVDDANQIHILQIIGMVSATTVWPYLYVSPQTFANIYGPNPQPASFMYLVRPRTGVSDEQVTQDLMKVFGIEYGLQVEELAAKTSTSAQSNLTIFFSCYLALGLFFGTLALGVIMGRAVVERRQQIGMLRAFGFSRLLVMGAFLMEATFIVSISLVIGTVLAFWSAYRIFAAQYINFPVPFTLILLILSGCYLVAFMTTIIPARQAARVYPSEALRYE